VSYKYLISQSNILTLVHVYRPHVMLLLNLRVVLSIVVSIGCCSALNVLQVTGDHLKIYMNIVG